jgi:outer membrane protein assembly factor BamB
LRAEDGSTVWAYESSDDLIRRFVRWRGRVYLLGVPDNVHCLDERTGRLLQKITVRLGGAEALLTDGQRLYVASHQAITALDESGRVLWTKKAPAWTWDGEFPLYAGLAAGDSVLQPDLKA